MNIVSHLKSAKRTTKGSENIYFKPSTYIKDRGFSYCNQALENVDINSYDRKFYVPQTMRRLVLDWYHFYLNHPGGSILPETIREV